MMLPEGYERQVRDLLGNEADDYLRALDEPYTRGLRVNPQKPVEGLPAGEAVPWEPFARYLAPQSTAGAHPLHEAGAYYLQEPSAMLPVRALLPMPGEHVLDLCAAPGGKSTQIAALMQGKGLLVCNEPVPARAQVLSRNIERLGVSNALVVSADPQRLFPLWTELFDAILVDAPCSGEGMFRRHPETTQEWSPDSPALCARRQAGILDAACAMLRPGGRLCYSTCTHNRLEDEETVTALLARHAELHPLSFSLPIGNGQVAQSQDGTLHLWPHQIRGEGHFVALLQKDGDGPIPALLPAAQALENPDKELLAVYQAFCDAAHIAPPFPATAAMGGALYAAPELPPLRGLRVLRAGVKLGERKGRVFVPDHALAMALPLPLPWLTMPLDEAQALRYQAGETIAAPNGQSGYILPTLHGLPLGWAKAADGRLNNHYPKGLRRPLTRS